MADSSKKMIKALREENEKLKAALSQLICWAGHPAEGPSWATSEAKSRNKAMCEEAVQEACSCFPDDYDGFREALLSN